MYGTKWYSLIRYSTYEYFGIHKLGNTHFILLDKYFHIPQKLKKIIINRESTRKREVKGELCALPTKVS